ncbi:hypothetical protein ACHAXA_006081 [Cyclostephanos tholiformis]|uniref:Uncharacterized protein n=1 Tax=Cyclostephanos tholiformis TaxID=382380 RepID=A0ABD3SAW6_9STRA
MSSDSRNHSTKVEKKKDISSLQRRVQVESANSTSERNSFETCFYTGLDLSNDLTHERPSIESSSDASTQMEVRVALLARRNREEMEEAAFERRVAEVVNAAKSKSSTTGNDNVGVVVPQASHPSNTKDETMGKGRDDNFLKLHGASLGGVKHGFLSSLVISNHMSELEKQGGAMSHKSRTLYKNNSHSKKLNKKSDSFHSTSLSVSSTRRQQAGNFKLKTGKVTAAKKSRISKY